MKRNQLLSILIGAGIVAALVVVFSINQKPFLNTDTDTTDGTQGGRRISTKMNYDMTLRYADGSKEEFAKNVYTPDLKFSLLSVVSAGQGNSKTVDTIEVRAVAELELPSDLEGIADDVELKSVVDVHLGAQSIKSETFSRHVALSDLQKPIDLYKITIPAATITDVPDGEYALSFTTHDEITFTIDGEKRVITSDATPTLLYNDENNVLKNFIVSTASAGASYQLERIPLVDPNFGDVYSYRTDIKVSAYNFKKNTPVTFDYLVDGSSTYVAGKNFDTTIKSDGQGSATHQFTINTSGYSMPRCYEYHMRLDVTDGASKVRTEIGCFKYSQWSWPDA